MRLASLRITHKLTILVALAALAISGLGLFTLQQLHAEMLAGRVAGLRSIVETIQSTSRTLDADVKSGRITRERALDSLRQATARARFGRDNYVALYDFDGIAIQHPNAASIGTSRLNVLTGGVSAVRLQRDDVRDHGYSVRYYPFPRPGSDQPIPKVAYAAPDGNFDLFISTSDYIDDIEDAFRPRAYRASAVIAGSLLTLAIAAWLTGRGITRPLAKLRKSMAYIAAGNLQAPIDLRQGGEVGEMAQAVAVFKQGLQEAEHIRDAAEAAKQRAAAEQHAARQALATQFETAMGTTVGRLADASRHLETTARSLATSAGTSSAQAGTVATAAREASANVQTVAAAAEQLAASVSEISRQVTESSRITQEAVADAARTDHIVKSLVGAAAKVGPVIELISAIARQTNMLALNATIESARAGDAGLGFAVVAAEVKSLARRTASATEDIATHITDIQRASAEAVQALGGITSNINQISGTAAAIAAAVEQQGAATAEIARNVQQTANSTQDVTENIAGVSQAAQDTGSAAHDVLDVATSVSTQSGDLSSEVARFVATIRAA